MRQYNKKNNKNIKKQNKKRYKFSGLQSCLLHLITDERYCNIRINYAKIIYF